ELAAGSGGLATDTDHHATGFGLNLGANDWRTGTSCRRPLDFTLYAHAGQRRVDNRYPFARLGVGLKHQPRGAQPYHHGVRAGVIGTVARIVKVARIDGDISEDGT